MVRAYVVVLCAVALSLVSCKTDDGEGASLSAGSCGGFMACGGDVLGIWTLQDICLDNAAAYFRMELDEPACAGVFRGVDARVSGTVVFMANGTGMSTGTMSVDMDTLWSVACLRALTQVSNIDIASACSVLETEYSNNAEFEGAACMVEGAACACLITSAPRSITSSGGFRVEGDQILDTTAGVPDDSPEPFCVAGNTLTVAMNGNGLTGQLTLSR